MFKEIKKLFGSKPNSDVDKTETKSKKPKKSAKQLATERGEPYINVLEFEVDKANPNYGSFELDWNDQFIRLLREKGYPGRTDEDVVDLWFQNVCRNVLLETYEQEQANIAQSDNVRYISRKNLGDGKTEIS